MSDASHAEDGATEATGPRPTWVAALVGALIAAAILVPTMLLVTRDEGADPPDVSSYLASESGNVEDRSEEVFDLLMNYDSETFDDVADTMLGVSTGNFRDQYEDIVGTGLNDALAEAGASSEGEILQGPQVTFRSATEAVALAGIEQTTRSATRPEGRTITYLMRLTLVRVATDGGDGFEWKADRIEILSGEAL